MQAALADATVVSLPAKSAVKIHPKNFGEAATRRNIWAAVIMDGTPYSQLFEPHYWANIAKQLRPGDLIEVTAEDGSYFAQLYVLNATTQAASVVELFRKDDMQGAELVDSSSGLEVQWKGPHNKWSVVRLVDSVRIVVGCATREDANQKLTEYVKALAR